MDFIRSLIGPDEGADAQQLCVRAVFLFVFGVLCIRIAGRRSFAQYTPLDIVVALIVGSNISRIMTGEIAVFPALGATLVLVILHRLLAIATMRWSVLHRLLKSSPIVVIRDGKIDDAALRRANMSIDDLHEAIRLEQAERARDVRLATMES